MLRTVDGMIEIEGMHGDPEIGRGGEEPGQQGADDEGSVFAQRRARRPGDDRAGQAGPDIGAVEAAMILGMADSQLLEQRTAGRH